MKNVRKFNFQNPKIKVDSILKGQNNEELFTITVSDHSSLFFSTFRTEDFIKTNDFFNFNHSPDRLLSPFRFDSQ